MVSPRLHKPEGDLSLSLIYCHSFLNKSSSVKCNVYGEQTYCIVARG